MKNEINIQIKKLSRLHNNFKIETLKLKFKE